jgi:hypothetical protein
MKWIGTYETHEGFKLKEPKGLTPSIIEKDIKPISEIPSGKE